jgi:DNA-binding NarL/FixJ family response regulator
MMYKVIWGVERKLIKLETTLFDYYKALTEAWNIVAEKYVKKNEDRRTNEYKEWSFFVNTLVHLNDVIVQTEDGYKKIISNQAEELRRLKFELSKWTDNQKGRRKKITPYIEERIKEAAASGMSNRAVAQKYKVDEKTVRMILKTDTR